MSRNRLTLLCAVAICLGGCRSPGPLPGFHPGPASDAVESHAIQRNDIETGERPEADAVTVVVSRVAFEEATPSAPSASGPSLAQVAVLSSEQLVAEVRALNPNLQALAAAWRAAVERYPQAISLEDPMFMGMIAPDSFDSDLVEPGYTLQGSQKFPWFGKRAIRGRRARATANAAYFDLADARLRLDEITLAAYFDYYLAHRQIELNTQNLDVIRQFRSTAQSRYEANQVTQQDVLQADLELAAGERRKIELARLEHVTRARINVLLRESPLSALAAPPRDLPPPVALPAEAALQELAIRRRPDVAALRARVLAEQAAVALVCKDYYPDAEVFGRYDAMWQEEPLRPAVGVNVNLPVYRSRLNAAVREARFTFSQRRAELEQLVLDVQFEVANAYLELDASHRLVELYDQRMLPAAARNVEAARANYDVSKATFFELATAQRQLITVREEREQVVAEYHNRLAALQRSIGGEIEQEYPSDLPLPVE